MNIARGRWPFSTRRVMLFFVCHHHSSRSHATCHAYQSSTSTTITESALTLPLTALRTSQRLEPAAHRTQLQKQGAQHADTLSSPRPSRRVRCVALRLREIPTTFLWFVFVFVSDVALLPLGPSTGQPMGQKEVTRTRTRPKPVPASTGTGFGG